MPFLKLKKNMHSQLLHVWRTKGQPKVAHNSYEFSFLDCCNYYFWMLFLNSAFFFSISSAFKCHAEKSQKFSDVAKRKSFQWILLLPRSSLSSASRVLFVVYFSLYDSLKLMCKQLDASAFTEFESLSQRAFSQKFRHEQGKRRGKTSERHFCTDRGE